LHADEQNVRAGCTHYSDHFFQIGASLGYWKAAQAIIGTELENDERWIVAAAVRGVIAAIRRRRFLRSRWH